MIRIFIIFILFLFSFAEELKINSKFFTYNPDTNTTLFKGDVNVTKGKDNILSKELIVYFNQQKKPIKFIATGDVRFLLFPDENTTYKGNCNKLIYYFNKGDVILIGDAHITKLETNESIKGDKVVINRITKSAKVIGKDKPVEIILKVNE